jgi:hypothetical protein
MPLTFSFWRRPDLSVANSLFWHKTLLLRSFVNLSLTAKVRLHARTVHLDRPSAGDPSKALQAGRSWRSGGGITGGQTPVAHLKRAQRRAPNLTSWDRLLLGVCALFVSPKRLSKMAVILKTSTLLCFHHALVKRKYDLLYSPRKRLRPGPKGPSKELIDAVVEMKRRNPRFGCRKIAEQISRAFAIEINKDAVRRILIRLSLLKT